MTDNYGRGASRIEARGGTIFQAATISIVTSKYTTVKTQGGASQ